MFPGLVKYFLNLLSWKTKRKLVVFEVDDYGSCHYRDNDCLDYLQKCEFPFTYFTRHDRLESYNDLTDLFDVLTSVRDSKGRHAVFTPMVVTGNPDFQKLLSGGFEKYYFENFYETITHIHGKATCDLWRDGIAKKIFAPQYHGREHVHVSTLLNLLKSAKSKSREAFENGILCFVDDATHLMNSKFSAAYGFKDSGELPFLQESLGEGIHTLSKFAGYPIVSFTPPAGGYSYAYEKTLFENGIRVVSLGRRHNVTTENGTLKKRLHYLGKTSPANIVYTPRTALFEPHSGKGDAIERCLRDIDYAFRYQLPAVVSSHRINFVNNASKANGNGIAKLKTLLLKIVDRWPETEFVSSAELAHLVGHERD